MTYFSSGTFIDTTLRDGEQAPGVVFSLNEKIKICQKLEDLGITEIEAGTPAMGSDEIKTLQTINAQGFNFELLNWCRATKHDLDLALKTGIKRVNISFPTSHIHLHAMDKSESWLFNTMESILLYAKNHFEFVAVGAQDASRSDNDLLRRFIQKSIEHKVDRIRIADTVGKMLPAEVLDFFTNLRAEFPDTHFEFHAHNDLGMATANAQIALQVGVNAISTTINGLGERAGNVAMEEIMLAERMRQNHSQYHLSKIADLCAYVAKISGRTIHSSKPVTGDSVFNHESGIHTKAVLQNKLTYQAYDEHVLGRKFGIVFGKHSGSAAVRAFFENQSIKLENSMLQTIIELIKQKAIETKNVLSGKDLMQIYASLQHTF